MDHLRRDTEQQMQAFFTLYFTRMRRDKVENQPLRVNCTQIITSYFTLFFHRLIHLRTMPAMKGLRSTVIAFGDIDYSHRDSEGNPFTGFNLSAHFDTHAACIF